MTRTAKDLVDTQWTWDSSGSVSQDTIRTAALLEIARAVRLMAQRYETLIADRQTYETWWREEKARGKRIERSNAALRGHLTRRKTHERTDE